MDTSNSNQRVRDLLNLHKELTSKAVHIMASKNHDYTSNSGDPYANFRGSEYLGIHPVLGIQLRIQDKMQRVKTFVEKGELKVKGESVEDAIIDMINYLVLAYGIICEENDKAGNDKLSVAPSTESGVADGKLYSWKEFTEPSLPDTEYFKSSYFLEQPRAPER